MMTQFSFWIANFHSVSRTLFSSVKTLTIISLLILLINSPRHKLLLLWEQSQ